MSPAFPLVMNQVDKPCFHRKRWKSVFGGADTANNIDVATSTLVFADRMPERLRYCGVGSLPGSDLSGKLCQYIASPIAQFTIDANASIQRRRRNKPDCVATDAAVMRQSDATFMSGECIIVVLFPVTLVYDLLFDKQYAWKSV